MYTSIVLVALSGYLSHAALLPTPPSWETDYATAWKRGREEKKPLAVVFGSGYRGWQNLSKDGKLENEAMRMLETRYVCVYLDTNQDLGKRLAAAFDMGKGPGLVISDRTGDVQAFRHEGELSGRDLNQQLQRYADPDRVARTTETRTAEEPTYAPSQPAYTTNPGPASFQPIMRSSGSC